MTHIKPSELILRSDGSIYHLGLKSEEIAQTIITVGDPERVSKISKYFDKILHEQHIREFKCVTGLIEEKKITVLSTGMGTDNIDIALTELDILANFDLGQRKKKPQHKSLNIIRIGTSGALQKDIPLNGIVASKFAVDLSSLFQFYEFDKQAQTEEINRAFQEVLKQQNIHQPTHCFASDSSLLKSIGEGFIQGTTLTCPGFYGPQGRVIKVHSKITESFFNKIQEKSFSGERITNFEMETAGIYGMCALLGHKALSLNLILANRPMGTFSEQAEEAMDSLIKKVLERIVKNS